MRLSSEEKAMLNGEFGEGTTFPQIVLNGKKLGGCSDSIRYLKEKAIL